MWNIKKQIYAFSQVIDFIYTMNERQCWSIDIFTVILKNLLMSIFYVKGKHYIETVNLYLVCLKLTNEWELKLKAIFKMLPCSAWEFWDPPTWS